MKKHTRKGIVVMALVFATAVPGAAFSGQADKSQGFQSRSQSGLQIQKRDRNRLRDGSCLMGTQAKPGAMQRRGNTYGPGDGTGHGGVGPGDGTGYGAPSNR